MVYLQIGQVLFLFALMYYYYDGRVTVPQTGVFVKWFKRMSRHSLTVYLVHYPLIPWSSSGSWFDGRPPCFCPGAGGCGSVSGVPQGLGTSRQ